MDKEIGDNGATIGAQKGFGMALKNSTAWILLVAATVVIFGGALTWAMLTEPNDYDYSNGGTSTAIHKAATTGTTASTTDATKDWKTYENTKYGFRLTFSDEWKNYSITETVATDHESSSPLAYLQISVPTTNNKGVVTIYIYTPNAYNASVKAQDPGPGTLLGRNDSYVFTYSPNNGLHGDPDITFNNTLIPNLAKTFKSIAIDPTADWQTYTNKDYGFSFKYPEDWKQEVSSDPNMVVFYNGTDKMGVNFYNSVSEEPENSSNHYNALNIDQMVVNNPTITKEEKTTLDGKSAYAAVWGGMSEDFDYIVDNSGKLIIISFKNKSSSSDLTAGDKQILATFKFN